MGLISNLGSGGDSHWIRRAGLEVAVVTHVREGSSKKCDGFLSFSEDLEIARRFALGSPENGWESCGEDEEEAIVFQLLTAGAFDTKVPGVYHLEFRCDRSRISALSTAAEEIEAAEHYQTQTCDVCGRGDRKHGLVLIDAERFLMELEHRKFATRSDALEAVRKHREWLVLPSDHDPMLGGERSFVPHSENWDVVERYKMTNAPSSNV